MVLCVGPSGLSCPIKSAVTSDETFVSGVHTEDRGQDGKGFINPAAKSPIKQQDGRIQIFEICLKTVFSLFDFEIRYGTD